MNPRARRAIRASRSSDVVGATMYFLPERALENLEH
jgi:hypothetical protein